MTDTFDKNGAQNNPGKRRCSVCGRWLDDDEMFCVNCGTKAPVDPPEPIPTPTPTPKPVPVPDPTPVPEPPTPDPHPEKKVLLYLAIGCGVVLVVSFLIIFFFRGKLAKKDSGLETQSSFLAETDRSYIQETENEDSYLPETEEEETEAEIETDAEEEVNADIDAVHNRNCTISGLLFYTDQMDAPVMVLEEPISLYVNSTSGEAVYYKAVSQISFGTCSIGEKKLKKYNNVDVDVTGSLWAENDFVYIDVQELSGELPETEKETKAKKETEAEKDSDYILPESNSRYLTDADVAGLSLKEINYAKNEIYARHGRKFDSPELQKHFNSRDWYEGTINPGDFSTNVFNSYERENVRFLAQKEESMQKGGYKLDQ
jgi:hypothetical protein